MTQISRRDLAAQLPAILTRVAQGEEFVVTDHGQAVARIVPPAEATIGHPRADNVGQDTWRSRFDDWMREVKARADRYPADFTRDDTRESAHHVRGT